MLAYSLFGSHSLAISCVRIVKTLTSNRQIVFSVGTIIFNINTVANIIIIFYFYLLIRKKGQWPFPLAVPLIALLDVPLVAPFLDPFDLVLLIGPGKDEMLGNLSPPRGRSLGVGGGALSVSPLD